MKQYKYCGEKKEDIHYFEDFVENFVDPEEVFISIEEEEECCNEQPPSCVSCYRNENLRYCGEDYPELGVYKGDHYDDVIDSIINYTNNIESTVLVKYEDGTVIELVTLLPGEHKEVVVPNCLPSTVEIYNSEGTLLQTLEMAPGTSQNYECPDAQIFETDNEGNETVVAILPSGTQTNLDDIPCRSTELTIVNTNDDVISEIELQSGETDEYTLPNTIHSVTVKDQNSNILDSESYSLYSSVDNGNSDIILNIPNGTVEVKNSNGDIVDTVVVPYGQTVDGNAPDATAIVEYADGTPIVTESIPSGTSTTVVIPNENDEISIYLNNDIIYNTIFESGEIVNININI